MMGEVTGEGTGEATTDGGAPIAIEREEGDSKGRYVARVEGEPDLGEAEMTYTRSGASTIIIDHTGVPGTMRGRGVGEALVERGVTDARTEGRSIIPLCPFAKAVIARHAEWQDVLK